MLVDKGRYVAAFHICCRGWKSMAESDVAADDSGFLSMEDRQPTFMQELDESMLLVREDICEWLNRMFDLPPDKTVQPSSFLDQLDDGVIICQLVKAINEAAGPEDKKTKSPRIRPSATSGSWFARDNIANFLIWCRNIGLRDEVLFETEGLVMHSEEKNLLLTLLELARLGANRNLDMPKLVRMEREIDREQRETTKIDEFDGLMEKVTIGETPMETSVAPESHAENKDVVDANSEIGGSKPVTEDGDGSIDNSSAVQAKSETTSNDEKTAGEEDVILGTPVVKSSAVDVLVHRLAEGCKCEKPFRIERLREGTYRLNGKMCFLRLFKENVMVRVGGGWLTLSQYLYRHDPCRIVSFGDSGRPKYMVARGRYKSAQKPSSRRMSSDAAL